MEDNTKVPMKVRLKGHYEKHKFAYGYITGAGIAILGAALGESYTKKVNESEWDAAEAYYDLTEPGDDKTVLKTREGRFYAYLPNKE